MAEPSSPNQRNIENYHDKHSTQLEQLCKLKLSEIQFHHRKTSIICTVGPSCNTVPKLRELILNGMNIARLNFSHGSYEEHAEVIARVREANENHYDPVAIALDTKGPEIRTGVLTGNKEVTLEQGKSIQLTTDKKYENNGTATCVYVDYVNLPRDVKKGSRIYVDDGLISLLVEDVSKNAVNCKVENGGVLGSRKVSRIALD
ncbi:unnamed protein product [Cylicostephanus goldi]|uniref:pyruvate kinase n=1 Tax=Cylicostephanus goldi TaxID=71465 RepID=A0A3P7NT51_CYLGO|nr:unnamed protein product [Cylicostephanus goldi]